MVSFLKEAMSEELTIVEERLEKMVAHTGGTPTLRIARFLQPTLACMGEDHQVVQVPSKSCKIQECPADVTFYGWKPPISIWAEWVDQMSPIYGDVWKKSGIYDAIITSTYKFEKNKNLILALADSWCVDTNTFTFPWGEATITLEDVSVIGGYSVLGEPVTSPLTEELVRIETILIIERRECNKTKSHKASHSEWLKHFMGRNDELEHVAFLSFWLSRYVLPTKPADTVNVEVLPIAIHLSKSTQIALAPAVLASLYRDLRLLKEKIDASCCTEGYENSELPLSIWAPFQIMQLWAWERFLSLQPTPNSLNPGEPRAARWRKLRSKLNFDSVKSSISSPDEFLWRPYSSVLSNWRHPLYYKNKAEWILVNANTNTEFLSFARMIVPCELVGLDCIEQYLPHRVGMQFGMDQDIPGPFTRSNADSEIALRTYDRLFRKTALYIPARLFESDVTVKYVHWWKRYISSQHGDTEGLSSNSGSSSGESPPATSGHTLKLPSSNHEDKMTILEWLKHERSLVTTNKEETSSDVHPSSAPVQSSSSTTRENFKGMKLLLADDDKNLSGKVSMRRDTGYEDSSTQIGDSVDLLQETCLHEVVTDADELQLPGLELEERVGRLEAEVDKLKAAFGWRKRKIMTVGTVYAEG